MYPNDLTLVTRLVDHVTPLNKAAFDEEVDNVEAIEAELGVTPSGTFATVVARLNDVNTSLAGKAALVHTHDASGLDTNAVTTSKINAEAVTNAKLATDAVTNVKIANNAINTNEIVNGAVTAAKLSDYNITTSKYADNSITPRALALVHGQDFLPTGTYGPYGPWDGLKVGTGFTPPAPGGTHKLQIVVSGSSVVPISASAQVGLRLILQYSNDGTFAGTVYDAYTTVGKLVNATTGQWNTVAGFVREWDIVYNGARKYRLLLQADSSITQSLQFADITMMYLAVT